jgi:methylmalonyl-CoA decarboxylase subunit alpha
MAFDKQREEFAARTEKARRMGSPKRLEERKAAGILNARERIARLLDTGTFVEAGLLATSIRPDMRDKSPGDGVVSGFGKISGRMVGVNAADFTTLGSSSAEIHGKKQHYIRETCRKNGMPLVHLMECAGGRIPDIMGATGIGRAGEGARYSHTRETPWASAVLGLTYGGGAFTCINSDFVVMRKGAVLAVSSSNVTSVAIAEDMDPEALGGWRLHSENTGFVDSVVDTDEDAIRQIQTYLSYFPDNASMAPPRFEQYGEDPLARQLDTLVPESRAKVYDIRAVLRAIADRDSVFPLKERFAKVAVTALARIRGRSVGFIATNPMFKGGALDPDACDKITNFIVLCDSFNIPIIFLADTPGFLVGAESEKRRLPGKIMNFMAALELSTVPKIALVLRKSFGQAYLNMGGGKSDVTATWFSGDISFMDPAVAVNVVHGIKPGEQPERYDQLVQEVSKGTTAYELAAPFMAQMVIDPNDTRDFLADMLEVLSRRMTNGVGQHRLADWPPAF